jgi:type III secretion protein F
MAIGVSSETFSLEAVGTKMLPRLRNSENQMTALLNGLGPSATAQDLLQAQTKMQQWTLQSQLQSAMIKEIGDALKGIVQKAG